MCACLRENITVLRAALHFSSAINSVVVEPNLPEGQLICSRSQVASSHGSLYLIPLLYTARRYKRKEYDVLGRIAACRSVGSARQARTLLIACFSLSLLTHLKVKAIFYSEKPMNFNRATRHLNSEDRTPKCYENLIFNNYGDRDWLYLLGPSE
jgi:hypothetical protein